MDGRARKQQQVRRQAPTVAADSVPLPLEIPRSLLVFDSGRDGADDDDDDDDDEHLQAKLAKQTAINAAPSSRLNQRGVWNRDILKHFVEWCYLAAVQLRAALISYRANTKGERRGFGFTEARSEQPFTVHSITVQRAAGIVALVTAGREEKSDCGSLTMLKLHMCMKKAFWLSERNSCHAIETARLKPGYPIGSRSSKDPSRVGTGIPDRFIINP
ncbi:hypothetical protein L596_004570 [Steinernema carpocapsae]|uniref:Uncharacterized protein n=1 Tax=Steinernema carpocapsae TaxID=34508 RepID=A0A4U8UW68_STECR|nr:hypothetical protein L596_004570 [Steinernema carpocapsae]